MSLTTLINRPCVIFTRSDSAEEDDYGNLIPAEGAVETVCEAQPRASVEPALAGEVSDSDWVGFFLPPDASYLNTASAVWIPELGEFEVVGMPPPWRNPRTQQASFVEASLKRTAGAEDDLGS